jgi:hypothetical protein
VGSLLINTFHIYRKRMGDSPTTFGIGVRMREKRRSWIILLGVHSERKPSSPPVSLVCKLMGIIWGVPNRP